MALLAKRGRHRGVTIVEAALVLPILLLLLLGLMEYGWIMLRAQQITHAARHGARVGARADSTEDNVYDAIQWWMEEKAGFAAGDYTPLYEPAAGPGQILTVTVTGHGLSLVGLFVPSPDSYEAQVSMAKEGPNASPGP